MEPLRNLKTILHSKRANIYLLEKCRVMVKGGKVTYLTEAKQKKDFWNIPIANTTVILLSTGTSITQAAVRMLSSAGVMIGFAGGGGTPLFASTEIEWMTPQSEYRPTEYVQAWLKFWFDDEKRLNAAKKLQNYRIEFLEKVWEKDRTLNNYGFFTDEHQISQALSGFKNKINSAGSTGELLQEEARLTKTLYKFAAQKTDYQQFTRDRFAEDDANAFLNHGNYLAYGVAATTLWVLGIPHGFAVMHGKTRRGALVFDIADLIKDAIVLPQAFISAYEENTEKEFRQQILQSFTKHKVMDYMFDIIKDLCKSQVPQ
ncbi:MAG: type I-F CRISPR-associated endonuclease Cas1f [Myxococcota bacterium]